MLKIKRYSRIYIATYVIILIMLVITGCTKPYNPPAIKNGTGYLVVEGVIDAGIDSTKFMLSHTVGLTSDSTTAPVTGAQFIIQGNDNSSYTLTGNSAGVYSSPSLNLDNSKQYRVDIKTTDGKEYQSDYVPVKVSPAIDSISYAIESNGLQVNLNTHDPANNTRYYRWNYTETWEFHAQDYSDYVSNGDTVLQRPYSQQVYYCYTSDNATNILLGSSAKLSQDVIASAPITFVSSTSEKVETEYSILVRQYALTSDAYNFWSNLKTNTQQLGSIFDALPSEINGNIHCMTDPNLPVVGYISASTIATRRMFVDNSSLPHNWTATYPYTCPLDTFFYHDTEFGGDINQVNEYLNYNRGATKGEWVPIGALASLGPDGRLTIYAFTATDPICGDCSVRGTTTTPSFWQ
jgi:hypothetical protein